MITAMTELIIFWTAVLVVALILSTLREVLSDGYGHTARPRELRDSDPFLSHPTGRRLT